MEIKVVAIPRGLHDRLLANCDQNSAEYDCLANSFVMRTEDGKEEIQIPCDDAAFELILRLARSKCPEIVSAIRLLARPSH